MKWKHILLPALSVFCLHAAAQNRIASLEYWTDGNIASRQTVAPTDGVFGLAIDMSSLGSGFHRLSFRTQDTEGRFSPTLQKNFYVVEQEASSNSVASLEYWIDGNTDDKTVVETADGGIALGIDATSLQPGIHWLRYRLRDANGLVGPTQSKLFYANVKPEKPSKIAAYSYWFNDGKNHRVDVEPTSSLSLIGIDVDPTAKVVPHAIGKDYVFSVADMTVQTTDDVVVGLRLIGENGIGSTAELDTIEQLPVTIALEEIVLEKDAPQASLTPVGGQMLCYSFASVPGDSLCVKLKGSATADIYDATGKRLASISQENPSQDVQTLMNGDRQFAFTKNTTAGYVLIYGGATIIEQTVVTLTMVKPSGIDVVAEPSSDVLPPYVYTISGRRIATKGKTLSDLPRGIYIANGKKVVVK